MAGPWLSLHWIILLRSCREGGVEILEWFTPFSWNSLCSENLLESRFLSCAAFLHAQLSALHGFGWSRGLVHSWDLTQISDQEPRRKILGYFFLGVLLPGKQRQSRAGWELRTKTGKWCTLGQRCLCPRNRLGILTRGLKFQTPNPGMDKLKKTSFVNPNSQENYVRLRMNLPIVVHRICLRTESAPWLGVIQTLNYRLKLVGWLWDQGIWSLTFLRGILIPYNGSIALFPLRDFSPPTAPPAHQLE